jgi:hypothetical protein
MRLLKIVAIIGLISFWGCSSVTVTTDHDPNVDFSKYKTFAIYQGEMPASDALSKDPLAKKRVIASVERILTQKGFKKVPVEQADFVVILHAGQKERMQITNYGYGGYGYGMYGRGWGPGYGMSQTDVTYYDETTLVIDLADKAKKELVWRGTGTGIITHKLSDEERDEVIAKILKDFPPQNK